jgi:hypothetical protein
VSDWLAAAGAVAIALLSGWFLPAAVMKRLVPTFEGSRWVVANYRGRDVAQGLGLVWLVWVAAQATVSALLQVLLVLAPGAAAGAASGALGGALLLVRGVAAVPFVLIVGALAFGLTDDVFGDAGARGFRGHLGALKGGRLTTGALKLFGIGALAAAAALPAALRPVSAAPVALEAGARALAVASFLAAWVLATLVIALAANLVNLTDVRPGRALKSYAFLAVLGVIAAGVRAYTAAHTGADSVGGTLSGAANSPLLGVAAGVLVLAVLLFGPLAAVWRYDLGERAMLGDGGANAFGAVAGYVIAANSPLLVLAIAAVILLALNLASERASFTEIIDRRPLLRMLDGLGRLREETDTGEDGGRGRT